MGNFPMKDLLHMKRNIESIVVFRSVHWFFSLLLSAVFPMKAPPSGKKNLIEQKKKKHRNEKEKKRAQCYECIIQSNELNQSPIYASIAIVAFVAGN